MASLPAPASMPTVPMGERDRLPMLGLGTWKSAPGEVGEAVRVALRLGYRHIDCAPVYGNEAEIGEALKDSFQTGVVSRDDVWITSKLWNDAHAPAAVGPALKRTLADLRLDHLDLYLIHWPIALRPGSPLPPGPGDILAPRDCPLAETWQAMEELRERGLCRHIGVSNFSVVKLEALMAGARHRPEMNQVELHPYLQCDALLAWCAAHGIAVTAYSPLGSPDRPAFLQTPGEPRLLDDPVIAAIAARHGASPAQVLLGWGIQRGTVVLAKSVSPQRIEANLGAIGLTLSEADREAIAALDRKHRYVSGTIWTPEGSPYTLRTLWDGE